MQLIQVQRSRTHGRMSRTQQDLHIHRPERPLLLLLLPLLLLSLLLWLLLASFYSHSHGPGPAAVRPSPSVSGGEGPAPRGPGSRRFAKGSSIFPGRPCAHVSRLLPQACAVNLCCANSASLEDSGWMSCFRFCQTMPRMQLLILCTALWGVTASCQHAAVRLLKMDCNPHSQRSASLPSHSRPLYHRAPILHG